MSDLNDSLSDVVVDRQSFTGDTVTNLTTGATFTAELDPIQDIELNTELGRDARESVMMYVSDRTAAGVLVLGSKVGITLSGVYSIFELVRRKDNPANLQVEFGLRKMPIGIDT